MPPPLYMPTTSVVPRTTDVLGRGMSNRRNALLGAVVEWVSARERENVEQSAR